jgi:hypothetical protein
MAKRPALTFDAVKAAKPDQAAPPPATDLPTEAAQEALVKRGRRPKADGRVYGMTLRISPALRRALRLAADADTESSRTGAIVSVHDVILKAVNADLKRRGIKPEVPRDHS